jgi:Sec-independent protein secretion pathway component TatC
MMAVPIVLLYELGLLAARVLIKKRVESVASAN